MERMLELYTKILLDTDIGTDIDDALCLAYLLAQPKCKLLGITTVSGEAEKRAMMASALCRQAGKSIPVLPGIEKPLLTQCRQPLAQQAVRLENWPHETEFPKENAIEFMRRTIRQNPGEITLLAIGPMTNVAALFASDPEIPALLKEVVLMCGRFTGRIAGLKEVEWNAYCDPYAAAVVYHAPVPIRSIGLDVTMQVRMTKEEAKRRMKADILKPVMDFSKVWFEQSSQMIFHDPLAAAVIFDQEICGFQRGKAEVELQSERLLGLTHWTENKEGKDLTAMQVDKDRFFDHYFGIVDQFRPEQKEG